MPALAAAVVRITTEVITMAFVFFTVILLRPPRTSHGERTASKNILLESPSRGIGCFGGSICRHTPSHPTVIFYKTNRRKVK
jgi:hypothetical protein